MKTLLTLNQLQDDSHTMTAEKSGIVNYLVLSLQIPLPYVLQSKWHANSQSTVYVRELVLTVLVTEFHEHRIQNTVIVFFFIYLLL